MAERGEWKQIGLAATVTLIVGVVGFWRNVAFYHDDAFISLRYARHFLRGHGLVWNVGEYVEGYTNFLHLLLVALASRVTGLELVSSSRAVNAMAYVFLLLLLVRVSLAEWRRAGAGIRVWHWVALMGVAASFPVLVWVSGGLEAPLFAFLVTAGFVFFRDSLSGNRKRRDLLVSGLAFGLASLTRPEGLMLAGLTLAFFLILRGWKGGLRAGWFLMPCVALVVPFVLWRHNFYGEWLPNTFYVKAAGLNWYTLMWGFLYFFTFVLSPPFLLLLVLLGAMEGLRRKHYDQRTVYSWLVIVAYCAYLILIGGDHMDAFRMFVPIIPLCWLTVQDTLGPHVASLRRGEQNRVLLLFLLLLGLQVVWPTINPRKLDRAAYVGGVVGRYIDSAWPAGSVIALNTAGSTPYFADDYRYIDMLGLNDKHIARREIRSFVLPTQMTPGHSKGDGGYVLSRKPDYVILGPAEGKSCSQPWFLSDWELCREKGFQRDYRLRQVDVKIDDPLSGFEDLKELRLTYYERVGDRWRKGALEAGGKSSP